MKSFSWIKYGIIIFIIAAIYSGNKGKIKDFANKTTHTIRSLRATSSDTTATTTPKINQTPILEKEANNDTSETKNTNAVPFTVEPKDGDSIVSNFTVNVINKVLDNPHGRVIFEDIVNKMVTNYHGALGEDIIHKEYIIKDTEKGSGNTAMCGDTISITYVVKPSSEKHKTDITYTPITKELVIGKQSLPRGLENGLIGMQEKGQRKILYNTEEVQMDNKQQQKKNFLLAEVTLNKVSKASSSNSDWGIFVDKDSFTAIGPKILCGDNVLSYYTLRDMKGKKLYDSKEKNIKINFEVGSQQTPRKISDGLFGLVKNKSKVSIVLDKKDLQYKDKNGVTLLPKQMPPDQLVILDIDTNT